ncbi:efflux RND transporter periplasmic adaptor subunit [Sphingobium sp. H39-3-25]|uniref:efflux RND transporter periplasmic adaptor subunit n=1 Tax=Sphingobium arseniciresistens TaxID=3030834 RepID=UPI0023B938ED|nr:efflux RND transporter periplasmic adaptor subunit [Sphingobium arseniciresistens]
MPPRSLTCSALAMLALSACGGEQQKAPPPPTVTVAAPLQRDVVDWDEYVGRFESPEDVQVMPRVSGQITAISFRAGVEVGKGTALFQIDPRPYRAALEQAKAQVLRSQAAVANAQSELKRAEELRKYQAVSQEEYETKLAALRTAQADLNAARAAVDARALDLDFTSVRAPITGRVSDRRVAVGDYVTSGQTLLTTVVSVNPIWFSFEGAESFYLKYIRQAARGERGSSRYAANPVEIQLADETGYNWKGRMIFVDNAIDNNSGTIRAHAEVQNPKGFLVPGMFGPCPPAGVRHLQGNAGARRGDPDRPVAQAGLHDRQGWQDGAASRRDRADGGRAAGHPRRCCPWREDRGRWHCPPAAGDGRDRAPGQDHAAR